MARDPVCGMEVTEQEAAAKKDHQGTTYYFCSQECREQFNQNPEQYVGQQGTGEEGSAPPRAGQPGEVQEKTGREAEQRPRKTA